ncbi:hypothetical protein AAZX31_15G116900 [Glycine max]|nr:hypothetical protein GLYMA_15G121900v4 [Glycine max]KAG4948909.1 hypothetical protein JHK86_042148 [Glycine max]KAG4956389.1 hypothetical protein JHK85_042769 [Glycine max]KAH1146791.1 hypothetical protein GYH30_042128 [Glycine max]KAH1208794.1 Uncharacterized protein GmHk_15G043506 [Glycine max]
MGTRDVDDDDDQDSKLEDKESAKAEKWKKHYSSKHRILLVGEGDFSFSLCLARAFGSGHNLVATSLDSYDNIGKKYSNVLSNAMELQERGCLVFHGVDAKEMSQHFFSRLRGLIALSTTSLMLALYTQRIVSARKERAGFATSCAILRG